MRKLAITVVTFASVLGLVTLGRHSTGQLLSHQVAALTLVEDVSAASAPSMDAPRMDRGRATSLAMSKLQEILPTISDLSVTSSYHAAALSSASDSSGHQLNLHKSIEAWVIQVRAKEQITGSKLSGFVVIDAASGMVKAASLTTAG